MVINPDDATFSRTMTNDMKTGTRRMTDSSSSNGSRWSAAVSRLTYETFREKAVRGGYFVQENDARNDFMCLCPLHEAEGAHGRSLHVTKDETLTVPVKVFCFSGCDQTRLIELFSSINPLPPCVAKLVDAGTGGAGDTWLISLNECKSDSDFSRYDNQFLHLPDLVDKAYFYRDLKGEARWAKVIHRFSSSTGDPVKKMYWCRVMDPTTGLIRPQKLAGETPPLYGTWLLADASKEHQVVWAVEGEKDVDSLAGLGELAISTHYVGNEPGRIVQVLSDRAVVIIPDNDDPGVDKAHKFAKLIERHCSPDTVVRVLKPLPGPAKSDITDWLTDGDGNVEQLRKIAGLETDGSLPKEKTRETDRAGNREITAIDLPILPEEFWASRTVFGQIRQAAWARMQVPDVVLYGALSRIAAMVDPRIRIDSGISEPASLNFYAAVVGNPGSGKTQSTKISSAILPDDRGILGLRDGLGVGTGEGLIEAYMGTIDVTVPFVDEDGQIGTQTKSERGQEFAHVWFKQDEGEQLLKRVALNDALLGPVLRSAWNGESCGQTNASADRRRHIHEGTYSLGMVIGFQPAIVHELLKDGGTGFPQRFMWCSAANPDIPDNSPEWPGQLAFDTSAMRVRPEDPDEGAIQISMPQAVRSELRTQRLELARGNPDFILDELDGQSPLMKIKIAGLLALLDGRRETTWEDWELAKLMYSVSSRVRDILIKRNRSDEVMKQQLAYENKIKLAVDTERALDHAAVETTAKMIAQKLAEIGERVTRSAMSRRINRGRRNTIPEAIDLAAQRGWVILDGEAGIMPGSGF